MRILHIINSLDVGSATNLLKLVDGLAGRGVANEVMAIRRRGELEADFRAAVAALHPIRTIDADDYDLVCGWLYQGCVAASLLAPSGKVIWNVRHALDRQVRESFATLSCLGLMASVLRARAVVANSSAALANHRERGLRAEDWVLIENGIDIERFAPGSDTTVRRSLNIDEQAFVMLQVARVQPHKGHRKLIAAFSEVAAEFDDVHLVLVGEGTEKLRGTRIYGVGFESDVRPYFADADLLVNPSQTESFPTVVLEAMSCGVPCVVTRTGASADLVGATGFVTNLEARSIAETLRTTLMLGREVLQARGQAARARAIERFSDRRAEDAYYQFLLQSARHAA